jgi:hypothetical protein
MEKKNTNLISEQDSITKVYQTIKIIIEEARNLSYQTVNFAMVKAYWDIGRVIVEEEQRGKARADYGSYLIKELSKKLLQNLGKGFDISNLKNMRQFYLVFPNGDALRRQLSWTHYRLIMRVNKKEARNKLPDPSYYKPLSSILKACHFFLFTSIFKKYFSIHK